MLCRVIEILSANDNTTAHIQVFQTRQPPFGEQYPEQREGSSVFRASEEVFGDCVVSQDERLSILSHAYI